MPFKDADDATLTKEQLKQKRCGLHARNKLVMANMRLAFRPCRTTARSLSTPLDMDELLHIAAKGLIRAAEKWTPKKGAFTTFATFWIRAALSKDSQQSLIKIERDERRKRNMVKRATTELLQLLGREPSINEVAAKLSKTVEWVRIRLRYEHMYKATLSFSGPLPLDGYGTQSITLIDTIESPYESPSDALLRLEKAEIVDSMLAALPDDYRTAFVLRYGLEGHEEHTIRAISNTIGRRADFTLKHGAKKLKKQFADMAC